MCVHLSVLNLLPNKSSLSSSEDGKTKNKLDYWSTGIYQQFKAGLVQQKLGSKTHLHPAVHYT